MVVEEIDPTDDEILGAWLEVANASARHALPDEPPLSLEEARAFARGWAGAAETVIVVARSPLGKIVGSGLLSMPTKDNLETAEIVVHVLPAERRRGAGTAVVEHLEGAAAKKGRTSLTAQSEYLRGTEPPARPFATKLGYTPALAESQWVLRLPVASGFLDRLEAANTGEAEGYRIVTWQGRTPGDLIEGMVDLQEAMSVDAPHGELARQAQAWDAERLHALEDQVLEMGNTSYLAGAVERATGRLVAYTVISVNGASSHTGRQFATIVGAEHRGHRLGLLVKIANLHRLAEQSPSTTRIQTVNADTNTHMMAVNAALGFVASGHVIAWQKVVAPPATVAG
ncbi:MAG: GNAT family N-acetyltransferase [Acidimicrobiales bacterium]